MHLKIDSDIHLEFRNYEPNLDNIDVYVIAGDLGQYKNEEKWLIELTKKYPVVDIVCVSGNHSYYSHFYLEKVDRKAKELSEQYERIHYLQNDSVVINGTRFVVSTLWSDFDKANPLAMYTVGEGLNDYKYIRYNKGQMRFTPQKALSLHRKSKEYIFKTIEESGEPCVVVTHHCPYSIEHDKISNLWSGFQSDLGQEFYDLSKTPILWCSGHTHSSADRTVEYSAGPIRFVSNQLGYPNEDTGYDSNLIIEI